MPRFDRHQPGTFCFVELATHDPDTASGFYGALFGWERRDEEGPPGAYTRYLLDGAVTAAQFRIPDDDFHAGMATHWGLYVAVDDVDAVGRKAAALGGEVVVEPCDLPGHGRLAVLRDPTGATLSAWCADGDPGCGLRDEPGALCWGELLTGDAPGAVAFYGRLLGWSTEEMDLGAGDPYTVWLAGEAGGVAGATAPPAALAQDSGWWMPYFQVTDPDASVETAMAGGGRLLVPPTNIPNAGRHAIVSDPGGAVFGIYRSDR